MNILISGSSGLIGTALIERLVANGSSVVRLVRSPDGTAIGGSSKGRCVAWDPTGGTIDHQGLTAHGPFDGVVNLAGAGIGDRRWNRARKASILTSRLDSTRVLVDALSHLDPLPGVLVSASAIGFYGDRGDERLTEDSRRGTGFLADVCDAWEQAAAVTGIRVVTLRTGIVLNSEGGALAKQLPLFRLGLGGRLGPGSQYQSWITLEDEVGAVLHALGDSTLSGPVNATAPHPVTNGEMARAIGRVMRRPAVIAVPATALRLALGREMADELVLASQLVLPTRLQGAGYEFRQPWLDLALSTVLSGAKGEAGPGAGDGAD